MKRSEFKRKVAIVHRVAKQYTGAGPTPRTAATPIRQGTMGTPDPKHEYLRSKPYRLWVASLACAHCGKPGPSQAAHSDAGADHKGMSIKADDSALWPGCADIPLRRGCHTLIGATGTFSREQAQHLAQTYIERTQARARAEGHWPKEWT